MSNDEILFWVPDFCSLSGSRAFGKPTENSDWDFYVPEKKWDEFKKRFYKMFENSGLEWGSSCPMHLYVRTSCKHKDLFEFSSLFPKNQLEYQEIKNEH